MRPVSTRACARALYLWQHLVRTLPSPSGVRRPPSRCRTLGPMAGTHVGHHSHSSLLGRLCESPGSKLCRGWRGRACSGTPAAAPRAGRQVFRWLLPGQGPRARRPARVGGAPSATLGVGVPRHRGPLRRGRRRNPITAPRAGRASQGCSAAGDGRVPGAPSAPSAERSPSGGGGRPARTPRGAVASARRSARFAAAGPQVRRTQDAEEGQPREKAAASPAESLRRHHLFRATPRPAPRGGKGRT